MASSILKGGVETATITGEYIATDGWQIKKTGTTVFLFITGLTSAPAGAFNSGASVIPTSMRPNPYANKTIQPRTGTARPPIAIGCNKDGTISFYNFGSAITSSVQINETVSWTVI